MGKVYQNIKFKTSTERRNDRVQNEFFFTDLDKYDFAYAVKGNGKVLKTGKFTVVGSASEMYGYIERAAEYG